jgi:hypothetical protein
MRVVVEETVVTRYFLDVEESEPLAGAIAANEVVGGTCDLMSLDQELKSRSLCFEVWRNNVKLAEFDSIELQAEAD